MPADFSTEIITKIYIYINIAISCKPLKRISQPTISRPPPLSFDPVLMDDAQCAE